MNGPTVVAIRRRLETVKQAAGALREALADDGASSEGFFSVRAIDEHLKDRALSRRIVGQVDAGTIALLMRDMERACEVRAAIRVTGVMVSTRS